MANKTRVTYPGKKGTWPNGEPSSVRDAYDKQLAEQASKKPAPKSDR
ncbi:hypothetical protein [Streptosporangium canum]